LTYNGSGKYNNSWEVVIKRTARANYEYVVEKPKRKKVTPRNKAKYNNVWKVVVKRTKTANWDYKKRHIKNKGLKTNNMNRLNTHEMVSLLISQNYECLITGINLLEDFVRMSPDHIIAHENGGENKIDNIIWMHSSINNGKNGDSLEHIIDLSLMVAYPGEENKYKRKQRIDEILASIEKIRLVYPKVYEKVSKMKKSKLPLLLDSRMSVIDLLNT